MIIKSTATDPCQDSFNNKINQVWISEDTFPEHPTLDEAVLPQSGSPNRAAWLNVIFFSLLLFFCNGQSFAVSAEESFADSITLTGDQANKPHEPSHTFPNSMEISGNQPAALPGRLIAKFRNGVGRQERENALGAMASRIRHLQDSNDSPKRGRGPAFFDGVVAVELKPGFEAEHAIKQLKRNPNIEYVEPDFVFEALETLPNDAQFNTLWGLNNQGQTGGMAGADIDVARAWDISTGSSNVVVAVIDTGVDYTHPDLSANIWRNTGEIAGNGIDDDDNGFIDDVHGYDFINRDGDPKDDHYHGTHCAGTIGAVGLNADGVAGVNWSVQIMALKFLGSSGSGDTAGAISAIQYAINNGAHVLSNSWGGGSFSQALRDSIAAAHKAGITVVAAAGNNGNDSIVYPASYDHVIAVSATDHKDVKASFSSYGPFVDVAAPGVSINSTKLNGTYGYASGTSMACPHVAGLAGLLKSVDMTLTPPQIEGLIETSAEDLGNPDWDSLYGAGRINAFNALSNAEQGLSDFPVAKIASPGFNQIVIDSSLSISGTASGAGFARYSLDYAIKGSSQWQSITSSTRAVDNGVLATLDTRPLAEGDYLIRLSVSDTLNRSIYHVIPVTLDRFDGGIQFPTQLAPVGMIDIIGSAATQNGLPFQSFLVEWGEGANPTSFSNAGITLANNGATPVQNGKLASWNTSGLVDGQQYTLRLTITASNGVQSQSQTTLAADADLTSSWLIPQSSDTNSTVTPVMADLDGDNILEIIVAGPDNLIRAYRKDGSTLPGFPITTEIGNSFQWSVNIDDLNNDGTQEIIAVSYNTASSPPSRIHIFEQDGKAFARWPLPKLYRTAGILPRPAVADLNGDGLKELVVVEVASWSSRTDVILHAYRLDGTELENFPTKIALPPIGSSAEQLYLSRFGEPSVADLDGDGKPEIAWSYSNRIILFDNRGNVLPGWPFIAPLYNGKIMLFESSAASGDIDGDGQLELFSIGHGMNCGGCETQLYAWRKDGSVVQGWPKTDQTDGIKLWNPVSVQNTPVLVDLDGDGKDELVGGLGTVAAFNQNGAISFANGSVVSETQPSPMDVDGDGRLEFTSHRSGTVGIMDDNGSYLWQKSFPFGSYRPTAAIASDLDADGTTEIAVTHADQNGHRGLYLWKIPVANGGEQKDEWPMFNGNPARTGHLGQMKQNPVGGDTSQPSCAITSPGAGATVSGNTSILVSASDNVGVDKVELLIDGVLAGSDNSAPYAFSWNTSSTSNGSHTLSARALDAAGNVCVTNPVQVTVFSDATAPAAPLLISPGNGTVSTSALVNFAWNAVNDDSGVVYRIQIDDSSDFTSPLIDVQGLSTTSYTPPQALTDGNYYWRIQAIDGAGNESSWSTAWTLMVAASNYLVAPSNLTVQLSAKQIVLNWQDNSSSEEGYFIERGSKKKGQFQYIQISQVGVNTTSFSEPMPSGMDVVYYRVRAFKGAQVSDYSNVASLRLPGK